MFNYLSYHQGRELIYGYGSYFTASEVVPVSQLSKDYWQEIDTLGHYGKYGLITDNLNLGERGANTCLFSDYNRNVRVLEISKNYTREIIIPSGYKQAIIFPDWEVSKLSVTIWYPDGSKRKLLFSASKKVMDRYLSVIVVSSISDYLRIDAAWKESVSIKEEQA